MRRRASISGQRLFPCFRCCTMCGTLRHVSHYGNTSAEVGLRARIHLPEQQTHPGPRPYQQSVRFSLAISCSDFLLRFPLAIQLAAASPGYVHKPLTDGAEITLHMLNSHMAASCTPGRYKVVLVMLKIRRREEWRSLT